MKFHDLHMYNNRTQVNIYHHLVVLEFMYSIIRTSTSDYEILISAKRYYPEVLNILSHELTDSKEITKKN